MNERLLTPLFNSCFFFENAECDSASEPSKPLIHAHIPSRVGRHLIAGSRRLETLLNVHPEKYRSRSNRPTRSTTPVQLQQNRSRSVDYLKMLFVRKRDRMMFAISQPPRKLSGATLGAKTRKNILKKLLKKPKH
ncbi:hypothetical protein Tcan_17832 [Toxocara canis]|uniref:Uncharacterized protein n=1 Tax=Toxocara canis TaxID=6265 RepID=A0A0B2VXK0_TOXCA|nr:hypothetical protein Tcan_17832 [Toxocara canis]